MDEENICMSCKCELRKPFIICKADVCHSSTICPNCFSKGASFGQHESDHPYTVCKTDFPLFEQTWTAEEETTLLEIMSDCGYGNWSDVAARIRTKSQAECQHHYNNCYIDKAHVDLPQFKEYERKVYPQPVVFKLCDDPPRYPENNIWSGYMAGRGDFTMEYDNFMELEVKNLSFEDNDEEESKMQLGVLDAYYDCLKERWHRKKIVRDYGLINMTKVQVANRRYNYTIKDIVDKLRVFMTLLLPDEYCKYLESIHYECELKNDIKKLQNLRDNGIISTQQSKMYRVLNSRRLELKSRRHLLVDLMSHLKDEHSCQTWLQRQAVLDMSKGGTVLLPNAPRKTAPPLDISNLPGFDKLSAAEHEICASVRLVPEAYIEFRDALVNECKKNGHLKLGQARSLIKIDVNKTRKLYDFLLTNGMINKDMQ